jgi:zinc protease
MKRIFMTVLIASLLIVAVAAQEKPKNEPPKATPSTSTEDLPSVDQILEKYVKSVGGKEALEKITSRAVKGTFEIEAMNVKANFENYMKAPNKSTTIVTVPDFGTFIEVYDGANGWKVNPMEGGLREISGLELTEMKLDAELLTELNLKKNFPKMVVTGKEKAGSYDTYVIEATPAEGGAEKLYFDVTTGLLVRQDHERSSSQGKQMIETYFDDFKAVDGVKLAHTIKAVQPEITFLIKFTEVKQNAPIEETKFNKPAN